MARKSFLWWLFSKNNLPLYVDSNGIVQEGDANFLKPDGQPAHLEKSPEGWKDTLVNAARNEKYFGVFRAMTVPMKFPGDGATILHDRMWNHGGVEAITTMGISKLNRTGLPYSYEPWYKSEINFHKFNEQLTFINIEALEGGLSKYLKANENTVYEFDIDSDPALQYIFDDGVIFDFSKTFGFYEGQAVTGDSIFYLGVTNLAEEGQTDQVPIQNTFFAPSTTPPNDQWFMKNLAAMTVKNVSGTLKIHANKNTSCNIRLEINNNTSGLSFNAPSPGIMLYQNPSIVSGQDYEIPFSTGPLSIPAGYQWHIKAFGGSGVDATVQFTVNGVDLKVEYEYKYPQTYIKALPAWRVFELLTLKIGNNQYGWISYWLATVRNDIMITCGDALRGLAGSKLKTSLFQFFKSMFRWGVGLGITTDGGELVMEDLPYFFQDVIIANLGVVRDAKLVTNENFYFNEWMLGYDKQDYRDVNGKYEPNQSQSWKPPLTKTIKTLDLKSPYRADPLGIELLRINYEKKKTTDSGSDNDTFMLQVNKDTSHDSVLDIDYHTLYRPAYSSVTNLPHWETYFNLELTPHKSILELGRYLHSLVDGMDAEKIKFNTGDKNTTLSTTLNGVTVTENEDVEVGSLGDQLFKPYLFTFKTQVPINLLELLKVNPYGKVQFEWRGRQWYGFINDVGIKPATNDSQEWSLIVAPENDLSKFNLPA